MLVVECRVGVLPEPFDVLPVECKVERLTYRIFPWGVPGGVRHEIRPIRMRYLISSEHQSGEFSLLKFRH